MTWGVLAVVVSSVSSFHDAPLFCFILRPPSAWPHPPHRPTDKLCTPFMFPIKGHLLCFHFVHLSHTQCHKLQLNLVPRSCRHVVSWQCVVKKYYWFIDWTLRSWCLFLVQVWKKKHLIVLISIRCRRLIRNSKENITKCLKTKTKMSKRSTIGDLYYSFCPSTKLNMNFLMF